VDAAFVAPAGELYVFKGGQYVRYGVAPWTLVDSGFPRTVKDDWGDLPPSYEEGVDGAFVLDGNTYLVKGDEYVRYSGSRYEVVDRMYPQAFRQRWAGWSDYRLDDVATIARYMGLARGHAGLSDFLTGQPEPVADPYARLSEMFGWDVDELKWLQRHNGFLDRPTRAEEHFGIEFLLKAVELFATARKFGTGPTRAHDSLWSKVYGTAGGEWSAAV
ncbi:hemopexin repeat-containing protein, partial [Kibdelosporangium lantanae]